MNGKISLWVIPKGIFLGLGSYMQLPLETKRSSCHSDDPGLRQVTDKKHPAPTPVDFKNSLAPSSYYDPSFDNSLH